jgi:hypothetical protein
MTQYNRGVILLDDQQRVVASEAIMAVLSYMPPVAAVVFTRDSAPFASARDTVMICAGGWLLD